MVSSFLQWIIDYGVYFVAFIVGSVMIIGIFGFAYVAFAQILREANNPPEILKRKGRDRGDSA